MGVPLALVRAKIFGACPVLARPYKAREDVYKSEEPADQAEAAIGKCQRRGTRQGGKNIG